MSNKELFLAWLGYLAKNHLFWIFSFMVAAFFILMIKLDKKESKA